MWLLTPCLKCKMRIDVISDAEFALWKTLCLVLLEMLHSHVTLSNLSKWLVEHNEDREGRGTRPYSNLKR